MESSQMKPIKIDIGSALESIYQKEQTIKKRFVKGKVEVEIRQESREFRIHLSGLTIRGRLTPALLHQIGNRIWPGLGLKETIKQVAGVKDLECLFVRALSDSGNMLRYYETEDGANLYGLTFADFVEMDQRLFRRHLMNAMAPLGIAPTGQVFETAFDEIVEEFDIPRSQEGEVGLSCRVIYGLNSGYSSYRLRWGRVVLVCSNGMTTFEDVGRDRWLHNRNVKIDDFVHGSVESAFSRLSALERKILCSKARRLQERDCCLFIERMVLARSTKKRLDSRIELEFGSTGSNEWSLSQALTYLGSHERAIPPRVRARLTALGTKIIDEGFDSVWNSNYLDPTAWQYDGCPEKAYAVPF